MTSTKRYRRSQLAATLLLGLIASRAVAAEPRIPAPQGFVSDFAGVVDARTRARIESLVTELKAKTGAEIAVVVVRTTQPLTAFDYAMRVAETWKPGRAERDNGVVFLVAVDDRSLFILTGYGVEGALPDGRVGEIRDQLITPAFRRGDYSGGIRAGTERIAAFIAADAGVQLTGIAVPATGSPMELSPRQTMLLLLALVLVLWLITRAGGWPHLMSGGGAHGRRGGLDGFGGGFGGGGGGFGGFGGGGGFGGFGGGGFGGGGAGGRW